MKTLEQLWIENGEKPIKIRHLDWKNVKSWQISWIKILGRLDGGDFLGYNSKEQATFIGQHNKYYVIYENQDIQKSEEELVPHWHAIIKSRHFNRMVLSDCLFNSLEDAKYLYSEDDVIRLATEYPPIMLPKKKD